MINSLTGSYQKITFPTMRNFCNRPNNKKSTKKNIAHAILQTATEVQSDSTFYDWKHIDANSGKGEVYTHEILPNSSKIFPLRIPERDILKKEKRSKLTIRLSEHNQNTGTYSSEESLFCTILCTRGSSNKKPLNCRIIQQSKGNGYQCDIASNFRKIEANNVKSYGAKNRIKNKLKNKKNYTIPTTLILVYKPIESTFPSAPPYNKTTPPPYSSSAGSSEYTLKGNYYPPKILELPK